MRSGLGSNKVAKQKGLKSQVTLQVLCLVALSCIDVAGNELIQKISISRSDICELNTYPEMRVAFIGVQGS